MEEKNQKKFYYMCKIQYNGAKYCGFQLQNELSTIQLLINNAFNDYVKGTVTSTVASRTDSGVHAKFQIIRICSPIELEIVNNFDDLLIFLNATLPKDIKILEIKSCTWDLKPSALVLTKEYHYLFSNTFSNSDIEKSIISFNPYPLEIQKIKRCLHFLNNTHNFQNFYSTGSNVKSTTRTLFECEIKEINPHQFYQDFSLVQFPDNIEVCYQFIFKGDGFLKQMIRHLVRALWLVGSGKISEEYFYELLTGEKKNQTLWKIAPAGGLYLYDMKLNSNLFDS